MKKNILLTILIKKLVLVIVILTCGELFAQTQETLECKNNLSIFVENVKTKNYEEAYNPWKQVYDSCPKINYAISVYAKRIINHQIKNSSGVQKTEFINLLLDVFDKSYEYYPKRFHYADMVSNKAFVYREHKMKSNKEIFEMFDDAFNKDRANFDNPKALYGYFSMATDTYNEGKKQLQEVFDVYDNVMERINEAEETIAKKNNELLVKKENGTLTRREKKIVVKNQKTEANFVKVISSIESKLGLLASCEKLIPLYKKNLGSHKTDQVWLTRSANRMEEKECTDDPIFVDIVESLHNIQASSNSAYYLGLLNDKAGKTNEALKYYNEALTLETDNVRKGKIALKIASKLKRKGRTQTAYNYAKKALKYNPSLGETYLLIASIYADSANACGSTTFEKRAVYWKAAEIAKKAKNVKPSLKTKANKVAESYNKRAPSKSDIFESGMSGKTVSFNCWIGGTIKVPNL